VGFPLDPGPQLGAEGRFGDQIDRPAEQVFQVELDAEVAIGGRGAVERDEDAKSLAAPIRESATFEMNLSTTYSTVDEIRE
jgi:hypothetical protein